LLAFEKHVDPKARAHTDTRLVNTHAHTLSLTHTHAHICTHTHVQTHAHTPERELNMPISAKFHDSFKTGNDNPPKVHTIKNKMVAL